MTLTKPNMRNLVYNNAKKHIGLSLVAGTISALAWKYGHTEPMRKRYEIFHRIYDGDKAEEEMAKAGIFSYQDRTE